MHQSADRRRSGFAADGAEIALLTRSMLPPVGVMAAMTALTRLMGVTIPAQ